MFHILYNSRTVDLMEAVDIASTPEPYSYEGGALERMTATIEQQGKLIARLLMAQYGDYADNFTETRYEPKTDAERLSFVLGSDFMVTE